MKKKKERDQRSGESVKITIAWISMNFIEDLKVDISSWLRSPLKIMDRVLHVSRSEYTHLKG